MYRHRKRLIAKRLSKLMKKKNQQYMQKLFAKFLESRSQEITNLLPQQDQQPSQQNIQQEIQQDQYAEEGNSQMSISGYISTLSRQEKRMFRRQNPDLPQTFFMSPKQKQAYFNKKNNQFQNGLKKAPQRASKNKNKVHFKDNYFYKPFSEEQKACQVKKAPQLKSPYDTNIHFS